MVKKHVKIHKIHKGGAEHIGHLHGGFLGSLLSMIPIVGPLVGNLLSGILGRQHGEGTYHIEHPTKNEMIEHVVDKVIGPREMGELVTEIALMEPTERQMPGHGFVQDDVEDEEPRGEGLWGGKKVKQLGMHHKKGEGVKKKVKKLVYS